MQRSTEADQEHRGTRLACVECWRLPCGDATGWRAYLTGDDQVAIYCPDCAEREFGEDRPV
jgi:hypothetical protein